MLNNVFKVPKKGLLASTHIQLQIFTFQENNIMYYFKNEIFQENKIKLRHS